MNVIETIKSLPHVPDRESDYLNAPDYYPWLNSMVKDYEASRILEVGVYLGYSAVAMIVGNPIEDYVGLDDESYVPGSLEKARENIGFLRRNQGFGMVLKEHDSQELRDLGFLDGEMFDLIHIDGDHSYGGALRDMEKFWEALEVGGHMLVDDSIYHAESVGEACIDFAKIREEPHYNVKTFRGTFVFLKTK